MIETESLVSLWTRVRKRLEAAGVATPVLDARLLVEAGAQVSRLDIVTEPRRPVSPEQAAAVEALALRRAAREPVAHILGRQAFWKLEFGVTPDALVPRPETELLVEIALELIEPAQEALVLDLGVGTGAILLSVLSERPFARGVGVDKSAAALEVARANASALSLSNRAELREGDWADGLDARFDLVLSNPPYLTEADMAALSPEVLHEPRLALDGGGDGLAAYRVILQAMPRLLAPCGAFAVEVGAGQARDVAGIAKAAGLEACEPRLDLAGIPRVVFGRARG